MLTKEFLNKNFLDSLEKSKQNICDGNCGEFGHFRQSQVYRVKSKDNTDWGFFSYCDKARNEDVGRGLSVEIIEFWIGQILEVPHGPHIFRFEVVELDKTGKSSKLKLTK